MPPKNLFPIILLLLLSSIPYVLSGQLKEGKELISKGNYIDAIPKLESAYKGSKEDPEIGVLLADCYLKTNVDKKRAMPLLEKAFNSGQLSDPDIIFMYAKSLTHHLKYKEAHALFVSYMQRGKGKHMKRVNIEIENCLFAMELLENPLNVTFRNLGKKVNTRYPDYYPFVSKNDSILYFTSRRPGNVGGSKEFDGYYPSDIYFYRLNHFSKAKNPGVKLNSNGDEQVVGLSHDGRTLFIYFDVIDYFGDIYMAHERNGVFTRNYKPDGAINSSSLETSATMSEDGQTLFFASNRPGGKGELDIYMSRKLPDGKWGLAQNLGDKINTPFNEDFPHLSADGNTLYFSSNGHPGMGGADIFRAEWNDKINAWGEPENIGYPINTPDDNMNISFSNNGKFAYISAMREDSYGFQDIYRVDFQDLQMPRAVVVFTPEVPFDSKIEIILFDSSDETVGIYRPDKNGKIVSILPKGKYNYRIERSGEEISSSSINITQEEIDKGTHVEPISITDQP